MQNQENLTEDLLELANCISDVPLKSLTDPLAFEPLVAMLHSCYLAAEPGEDAQYRIAIAYHLLNIAPLTYAPILEFIGYEPCTGEIEGLAGHASQYIHSQEGARWALTKLLENQGDKSLVPDFLNLFHICRSRTVLRTLGLAAMHLDTETAVTALSEILISHENGYVRYIAALIFSEQPMDDMILPLILALQDSDPRVSREAVISLKSLKSPDALPFLIDAIKDMRESYSGANGDPIIGLSAIEAIHAYETTATREIVFNWSIQNIWHDHWHVRNKALEKLGELQDNRAIPYLVTTLEDIGKPNQFDLLEFRAKVIKSLQQIGTPQALAALESWQQNNP